MRLLKVGEWARQTVRRITLHLATSNHLWNLWTLLAQCCRLRNAALAPLLPPYRPAVSGGVDSGKTVVIYAVQAMVRRENRQISAGSRRR